MAQVARMHGIGIAGPKALALGLLLVAGKAVAALPPVPVPPENPQTEQKRALGKILFWDEQLSTSNTVSCGTCHSPARGGTEPRAAGIDPGGDNVTPSPDDTFGSPGVSLSDINNDYTQSAIFATRPQVTGRGSPSMINAAYAIDAFWDGRARSQFVDPETNLVAIVSGGALESQVVGPPMSSVEMAHSGRDWSMLNEKLRTVRPLDLATNIPADLTTFLNGAGGRATYPELFQRAFGSTDITSKRIAFAIAAYERTLVSDQTPWDQFIAGNTTAMTPNQIQGWNNFQGPAAKCNLCHVPPLFTNNEFRNIGLRPTTEDNGRQTVTGNAADRGKFKVPSLRNVGLRQRFMHTGQFTTIPQVLGFYDVGAPQQFPDNIDPIIPTINVPPNIGGPIDDFISHALTDPRVANQQFPFDRPTLATERAADRPTVLANTGVAGSGGVVPNIIVQAPGLLHSLDFRVGLERALGGRNAQLGVSRTAPANGRITPEFFVENTTTSGTGNANGLATVHSFISIRDFAPGTVLFYQWFISDPSAVGGQALSTIGRVPVFCGSAGCPSLCDSVDFNRDGLFPDTTDIDDFLNVFSGGPCSTGACGDIDFNNDGLFPDTEDIGMLLQVFSGGPCT